MYHTIEVVPTITSPTLADFAKQWERLSRITEIVQIDIQDGVFVPNTTLSAQEVQVFFETLSSSMRSTYSHMRCDIHLMQQDYGPSLRAVGAIANYMPIRYIFVHRNFAQPISETHEEWSSIYSGLPLCPAHNPEDPPIDTTMWLGKSILTCPAIQIMTIHPGPQGQTFISQQLTQVEALRKAGYTGEVMLDGGINANTMHDIRRASDRYAVSAVCVGSYLSQAPDDELIDRMRVLQEG